MMKIFKQNKKGFTLVEAMIAVGLFSVIMTIGIGAILAVNSTHRKTQSMRIAIDGLSFLMEDMARSMRLGADFYCDEFFTRPDDYTEITINGEQVGHDCQNANTISFEPYWEAILSDPTNQIVYFIDEDTDGRGAIFKKENYMEFPEEFLAVTSADIDIDIERSGFSVVGAEDPTDGIQPRITVVLVGTVTLAGVATEFNMQTTVSQRLLDIDSFN